MKSKLFFCADVGTSSLKAALIDSSGVQRCFARVPYTDAGSAAWLAAFYSAAEQLSAAMEQTPPIKQLSPEAEQTSGGFAPSCPVSALIISGSGPTLVPVSGEDPASSETARPIYWYDQPNRTSPPNRASPLTACTSPLPACASLFLPKLKTFIDADPSAFAKTRFFFSPQEWLLWKLGARPVTVIPHDGYLPYYWDEAQCAAFGICADRFPPFVKMGEVIGELSPAVCARLAKNDAAKLFAPGILLAAGAADFIMAMIGTGTLEPGTACDRTGSSEGINLCVTKEDAARLGANTAGEKPAAAQSASVPSETAPSGELRLLPHAIEGLWNLGAVIPASGILFDQYRLSSGQSEKPCHELTEEIFADPDHPGKAVLETMGNAFVKALESLESSFSQPDGTRTPGAKKINELVLSGGQCADPLWNQYKADISGRILKVPALIHAELAGNAILAAAALDGGTIREKAAAMIRIQRTFVPAG